MNGHALFFVSVSALSCSAQDPRDDTPSTPPAGEERAVERAGREKEAPPIDPRQGEADLALTQRLRLGLMQHEALSLDAKNVQVITQGGRVTLRGEVKNAKERVDIERVALKTAGSDNVDSQLEVLP